MIKRCNRRMLKNEIKATSKITVENDCKKMYKGVK